MPLCDCKNGPKCEYHYCGRVAHWSSLVPTWKRDPTLAPKFFCVDCWEAFKAAWSKPLKGIDRPPGADEYWRPSLSDHLRLAQIDVAIEERAREEAASGSNQLEVYRSLLRKHATGGRL